MTLLKFILFYFVFISFMTLLTKHDSTKKPTVSGELSAVSASTEAKQQQADPSIKPCL